MNLAIGIEYFIMKYTIAILLFTSSFSVFSHGGATYKSGPLKGCHEDKKQKNFHCHNSGTVFKSEEEALYKREAWGNWATGSDCLDTRNKILKERSLIPVEVKNCKVISGKWDDYYYPEKLEQPKAIDIDHVVPLKEAHETGGASWPTEMKKAFYNDPENLVITNLSYNRQKGAKTILEWMPMNRNYACKYVKHWMHIKKKYQLTITDKELEEEKTGACK
jgi:hypothetical protein